MTYKFLTRPFEDGAYEPEGIYLSSPVDGDCTALHFWGEHEEHYGHYTYNGVPLKGHHGIDFLVTTGSYALAVDPGRVIEIGEEQGGLGQYLKVEHRWGESFYAHLDTILVDAGQQVSRGAHLAIIGEVEKGDYPTLHQQNQSYLHFGIRIRPFNRFDGWGGFVDPLPYLNPTKLIFPSENSLPHLLTFPPHTMVREQPNMRRP